MPLLRDVTIAPAGLPAEGEGRDVVGVTDASAAPEVDPIAAAGARNRQLGAIIAAMEAYGPGEPLVLTGGVRLVLNPEVLVAMQHLEDVLHDVPDARVLLAVDELLTACGDDGLRHRYAERRMGWRTGR